MFVGLRFLNMRHGADEILDSNGPIFMPNSRLLQQMLRFDFDHYQEETSDGKCPMDPSVICVEKGTALGEQARNEKHADRDRYFHSLRTSDVEGRRLPLLPTTFSAHRSRK